MSGRPFSFYEFFAGGGMARAGLGEGWDCLFANDFDLLKARTYRANWGDEHLREGDVWALTAADLPGRADLAWASSPCQDLSVAGKRGGLSGARSSAFWGFWRLIEQLAAEGRAPRTVVIENVTGLLSSHEGEDFIALCRTLDQQGYRFGALEIDAAHFLPQSRPRLFVVATPELPSPALTSAAPSAPFHSNRLSQAFARLPSELKQSWVWWRLAPPSRRNAALATVLEPESAIAWHMADKTESLLRHLGAVHVQKLQQAQAIGPTVGTLFRRVRVEAGARVQRAELRFDGTAGCLRTPGGGSSRQFVVPADGPP
jgi:DNA (cytosine-5)-methyltransferase 1